MKQIVLVFLSLFLTACSQLPWPAPSGPSIEQLRDEHRYLTALKTLNARRGAIKNFDEQRDALLDQARQYQSEMLRDARALQAQQQFEKAQQLFEQARAELPDSRDIDQFGEQFYPARDRYVQHYLDELIRLRTLPLARQHATYQALEKAAAEPELKQLVERHQQDVDYFAPLIAKAGAQALEQGEYTRAMQYLTAANQLAPSPQITQQLKSTEQAIAANKQRQQIARTSEREQRYRDLSYALQQSLDQRDFLAARDQLEQARALGIHADELDTVQKQLDEAIGVFVAQHIDSGNRHYANGRIEEALQHWRQADLLVSTPELKEKIEKAQKFIGRLQQLQKPAR